MDVMAKKVTSLLKILFLITLLTFPLGQIARIQLTGDVAVTLTDGAVAVLILLWLASFFLKKDKKIPSLTKPFFIFITIALFSLLLNFSKLKTFEFFVAFLYLLRWTFYAFVYFAVTQFDTAFLKRILFLMVFVGGVFLTFGFVQYFFYPYLGNLYYLGWDEHLFRLFSSFLDPNFSGAFLVLYFLLVLGLLIRNFKNKALAIFLSALTILTVIAIFLTYSRSAYVMFFAGVFVFLLKQFGKRFAMIGFVVLFLAMLIFLSTNKLKSEGTNLLRTVSTEARMTSAVQAINVFKTSPIFGVGFNAYRYANKERVRNISKRPPASINHAGAGTDNSFLFVLATMGIVGLVSYIFLWFKILESSKSKTIFSTVLLASAVSLFMDSLFVNSLFYTFIMLWMWILIGITQKLKD